MEVKLDQLIEKIRVEGIEEAKRQAQAIIEEAQTQAKDIINKAQDDAAQILQKANDQAKQLKENTEAALRQAGRDVLLMVREKIKTLFQQVLLEQVDAALTPEMVRDLILSIVSKWEEGGESIEITVAACEKQKIEKALQASVTKRFHQGFEVKVSESLRKGFFIGSKGNEVYYDFSEESVAEALFHFLSPAIVALLQKEST